jgi:hypothetical protein
MKDWFYFLLTSSTKVSSKRVIAIFVSINLIVISYIAVFSSYDCPIAMFDTLALLSGGLFSGTVIEKFTKKETNGKGTNDSENSSGGNL